MEKKYKVLVVEDNEEINKLLSIALMAQGYIVNNAFSGTECLLYLQNKDIDVILLDLMIPGIIGEEAILKIREITKVPVIVISAKTSKNTKLELLNNGADDFICKAFDIDEVMARINANLRRYHELNKEKVIEVILRFKDIALNCESKIVTVGEMPIVLTAREFAILELLLMNKEKIFSKSNIFESIWKEDFLGDDNTVNVHMSRIRNKLSSASKNKKNEYIETIWGMGYRLKK